MEALKKTTTKAQKHKSAEVRKAGFLDFELLSIRIPLFFVNKYILKLFSCFCTYYSFVTFRLMYFRASVLLHCLERYQSRKTRECKRYQSRHDKRYRQSLERGRYIRQLKFLTDTRHEYERQGKTESGAETE